MSRAARAWPLLTAFTLVLAACDASPPVHRERLLVFGTLVDVSLYGADQPAANDALDALEAQLRRQHTAWHAWEHGELDRLNRQLTTGDAVPAGDELYRLIRRGRTLAERTDHHFNPAAGRLIELWGFHADTAPEAPPPKRAIEAIVAAEPRMSDLHLANGTVRSQNPAVQLDFGGFAKGYAVDCALDRLASHGIDNAIISIGGDIRTMGQPDSRRWRVGLQDPRGDGILATLDVDDGESVFTSGDYERFFEHDGERYHHILDSRSGYPARGLSAVTVVHDDALVADAAATALLVAGPDAWRKVAKALDVDAVMVIDTNDRITLTPALASRLSFEREPTALTVTDPL